METNIKLNQPLDKSLAEQMITALHSINNIQHNPDRVPQPEDESQLSSLRSFLADNFVLHASEFLGSWIAVANEYEPLVSAFAALQRRASGLNTLRLQQQLGEAQQEITKGSGEFKVKKTLIVPANVIPATKHFRK